MIRLITSDIDGTLLPEGTRVINPEYFQVIRDLSRRGIRFAGASGRCLKSERQLFTPVENEMIFLAHNGGTVYENGKVIYDHPFEDELLCEVVDTVRRLENIWFHLEGLNDVCTERRDQKILDWLVEGYGLQARMTDNVLSFGEPVYKAVIYDYADPRILAEALKERFGDRTQVFVSGAHWLDILPAGVNKAAGLEKLAQHMGIGPEEIMAFGDNINDIPMLEYAGVSYAVRDAREEVIKTARFIADGCSEDGVLKVMKTLLQ